MAGRTTRASKAATPANESLPTTRRNVKKEQNPSKAKSPPSPEKAAMTPTTRSSRKTAAELDAPIEANRTKKPVASRGKTETKQNLPTSEDNVKEVDPSNHIAGTRTQSPSPSHSPSRRPGTSNLSVKEELRSSSPSKSQNRTDERQPVLKKKPPPPSRRDLEREKRKVDPEVKMGSSIVGEMSGKDMQTFLDSLNDRCSPTDTKSHLSRATILKWDSIAFGPYSGKELRAAWRFLRTCTRSYRIMSELVQEVRLTYDNTQFKLKLLESLPDFPQNKRFGSAFHTYLKEKWDSRTEEERDKFPTYLVFQVEYKKTFDTMSSTERQHWEEESNKVRGEHDRQVQAYFKQHLEFAAFKDIYASLKLDESKPKKTKKKNSGSGGVKKEPRLKVAKESMEVDFPDAPALPFNPQGMFINSRLKKLDPEDLEGDSLTDHKLHYSQKWNNLSDRKKAKWIGKCINKCQEYQDAVEEYQTSHPGYIPPQFKLLQKVSRTELGIWEKARGRPVRPPYTINELFQNELLERDENKQLSLSELKKVADSKFNALNANDKDIKRINFKRMVVMYRKEIQDFYNSVPDVVKPSVYSTIPKKFREGLKVPGQVKIEPVDEEESSLVPNSPPSTPPSPSPAVMPSTSHQLKKHFKSAEFVEDSNSSVEAPKAKKKKLAGDDLLGLECRVPLPEIDSVIPSKSKLATTSLKAERSPSPVKRKKQVGVGVEDESEESEHVFLSVGIPSDLSGHVRVPKSEVSEKRKQKKEKEEVVVEEPEIQIMFHSQGDDIEIDEENEEDEEEDEEEVDEEVEKSRLGRRLPPFPEEDYNKVHDIESSSEEDEEDEEDEESSSDTQDQKQTARTSKAYRDKQVEKYQNRFSR